MLKRLFLLISFSFTAYAESHLLIEGKIYDIDVDPKYSESLILLTNGKVLKTSQIKNLFSNNNWKQDATFQFKINDKREILEVLEISKIKNTIKQSIKENTYYTPSTLGSLDWAQRYFNEARYKEKESQCFNRAHVWTYEWKKKHNFNSMKMFLFFTRRYIRKYNFEWWFHLAPYIQVIHNGKILERVMDIKYAKGPLQAQNWANIFLKNNANCRVVSKYSEYANYPESGSCFFMRANMFYYQPIDLELLEIYGDQKDSWRDSEIREAYREAFDEFI